MMRHWMMRKNPHTERKPVFTIILIIIVVAAAYAISGGPRS